jgi:hypothetical protein
METPGDGVQETTSERDRLAARAMLFQQQVAEALLEAADLARGGEAVQIGGELGRPLGFRVLTMAALGGEQAAVLAPAGSISRQQART